MNTDLAAQHAIDHLAHEGVDALSGREKTLASAWLFEAGVSNSGFGGYFASTRGDLAFFAPAALRTIGAFELAEIAAEANAVFGPEGPPKDRTQRRLRMHRLPASAPDTFERLEERFSGCEEDIDELLDAYLNQPVDAN